MGKSFLLITVPAQMNFVEGISLIIGMSKKLSCVNNLAEQQWIGKRTVAFVVGFNEMDLLTEHGFYSSEVPLVNGEFRGKDVAFCYY